jgi:tRNA threonylcarbamoyladenosine biosynthesis protein TsaE
VERSIFSIRTTSEAGTIEAGRELAASLRGVVLLTGQLGAGKTTLVRGIVSAIPGAHADEVSSPTFTLVNEYGAGVYHLDLYRIENRRDLDSLGFDDLVDGARLVLVEWGERFEDRMPRPLTKIALTVVSDEERLLEVVTDYE